MGGATAPVFNTASGSTLNFKGSVTATTTTLSLNAGSNSIFTGSGTITPTAAITFGNFQINSGITTTLAGNITVAGNWTNNSGTLSGGVNTVIFSGASKTIGGTGSTDFSNINIATGASTSLSRSERLIGAITLTGTGQFNTNNYLTLVSTSSGTASIGTLGTPANFTGNITMQRYVSGAMGYRYIGSAISGATLAGLTPEMELDGMTGGTYPTYWCNVYTYNEATAGAFANGWTAATNVTNLMNAGKGFAVYFYSINIPNTLDLTGAPNTGNQSLPVSYTSSANVDDGWNLVSNPYPSTIDWDAAVGWTRTNIQGNAYYAWNDAAQNYASYPAGGPGVNGGTNLIASSQGFTVKTNAAGPALNMTENVKVSTNPSPQFWKASGIADPYAIKLNLTSNANTYSDESVIRFMSGASNNKDLVYDADKLTGTNAASPYMATLSSDALALCVNSLPDLSGPVTIPVMIQAGAAGTYTIKVYLLNQFPAGSCLVLEDLITGSLTDIRTNPSYSFTMSTTSTPVKRFLLHVSPPQVIVQTNDISCNGMNNGSLIIKGNAGYTSWNYIVRDSANNIIASANNATQADTIKNLKVGKYTITSSDTSAYCNTKSSVISIHEPSPVSASVSGSNISCSGMNDGTLSANASGGSGIYFYSWSNGAATKQISDLSAGNYSLTVKDGNNCIAMVIDSVKEGTIVKAGFIMSDDTLYLNGTDSIQLTNGSIGANYFVWDLGDSASATTANTTHTYTTSGNYIVKLYAYNANGCIDSIQYNLVVLPSVPLLTKENKIENAVQVYCSDGNILINSDPRLTGKANIEVLNSMGQQVFAANSTIGMCKINISGYSAGIYFVCISTENDRFTKKVNYIK